MQLIFLVFLVGLFSLNCSALDDIDGKWSNFKKKYSKNLKSSLNSANERQRFNVFQKNMLQNEKENKKMGRTYKLGETIFSHLTFDEFKSNYLAKINLAEIQFAQAGGVIVGGRNNQNNWQNPTTKPSTLTTRSTITPTNTSSSSSSSSRTSRTSSRTSISSSTNQMTTARTTASTITNNLSLQTYVNWTAQGKVSPVKFQGACGSCYAFTAVGVVESAYAIKFNTNPIILSEQQIVDCTVSNFASGFSSYEMKNYGCNGGDVFYSIFYAQKYGLMTNSSYPYISGTTGKNQSCQYQPSNTYKISNYQFLDRTKINDLKQAVAKQPITAYYYVESGFYQYKSGIYYPTSCQTSVDFCMYNINHAVVITGYGIENGVEYWIAKNSWSTWWGENGYFRIPLGKNACCIEYVNFNVTI